MNAPKRHPLDMTPEEVAESDARAEAQIKAGRGVPHEKVVEWLKTWGTPDFKPMPREWLE
jgi:predicted transcriptional regulator